MIQVISLGLGIFIVSTIILGSLLTIVDVLMEKFLGSPKGYPIGENIFWNIPCGIVISLVFSPWWLPNAMRNSASIWILLTLPLMILWLFLQSKYGRVKQ